MPGSYNNALSPARRTQAQQEEIDRALQVIKTIDNLAQNEDFRDFMARFTKESDDMAGDILHSETLSLEDREKLRQKRQGILSVLTAPKLDREAQIRVLAKYGINP